MEPVKLVYPVEGGDLIEAGEASSKMKLTLKKLGLPPDVIRRASICMYEGGHHRHHPDQDLTLLTPRRGAAQPPPYSNSPGGVFPWNTRSPSNTPAAGAVPPA